MRVLQRCIDTFREIQRLALENVEYKSRGNLSDVAGYKVNKH